jgi:putative Mg2+ transporter-C (MgtC) family protein
MYSPYFTDNINILKKSGSAVNGVDLQGINLVSIIVRLVLASLFGGIIGFERQSTKKPAGLRTHMLICIGSALVMLTGQYVYLSVTTAVDPTRLGAQVISGIGFLGIGTIIIVGKQYVRGLTTAAGLWASACMGLAIGIGFYSGAIVAGILIFIVEAALRKIDTYISNYSKTINLYIEVDESARVHMLREYITGRYAKTINLVMTREQPVCPGAVGMTFYLRLKEKTDHLGIVTELMGLDGIKFVQEV